ncbi:toll/interleukin-1 receptor domain-containing protein [Dyella sp. Tek66A03]|uniref:toll/interleukin-1 receptor domain-containing protein n=1 Tax=Dyella sp. Tek66A03 TaxID=3458298 RepID=UPI00403E3713
MALLTESEVRAAARNATTRLHARTESLLREARQTAHTSFDVFLSHSRLDSELVLGIKVILESAGQSVYVDWIDDPLLDRSRVTPTTAETLRVRMRQSQSLIYIHSANASTSRWMPWELGYFDGYRGHVAVLPVVSGADQTTFRAEEYLGLYPYVDMTGRALYVHRNYAEFKSLRRWQTEAELFRPTS